MSYVTKRGYWLGTEQGLYSLNEIDLKSVRHNSNIDFTDNVINFSAYNSLTSNDIAIAHDEEDEDDDLEFDYMSSIINGIGILRISGPIVGQYNRWNRWDGVVSYQEIKAAALELAMKNSVRAIVLDISSPGGVAPGVDEAGSTLSMIDRDIVPVFTYTSDEMASAALWLGVTGRQIWASALAQVGSIGVVAVHLSLKRQLESNGIKVTILRKGKFKFMGNPYEDLSDEAKEKISADMDVFYNMFVAQVSDRRGISTEALKAGAAQGQMFLGLQAVQAGLIDNVGSFESFLTSIMNRLDAEANMQSTLNQQ